MARHTIGFERLGVDLDKVTATGYTTCPKCSETRKQANRNAKVLRISLESGHYKCHHCDFSGRVDSDQWIEQQNLPAPTQKTNPKPVQKKEIKPFKTAPLTQQGIDFLKSRGISKQTAKKLQLAQKGDVLIFNYYSRRKIVNAKYRKIGEKKFYQHVGGERVLYNIDSVKNHKEIIFVEGEFDVAALIETGFDNSVSVSQGAPNAGSEVGSRLECLNASSEHLMDKERVIIFTDQDENGRYLEKILIERFGSDRCAVVKVPESLIDPTTKKPCKDANAVLIHYGKHELKKLVESAQDVPIAGVRTVRQVEAELWQIYNNGYDKGVSTGMRCLDGHFSFYKPWWNLFYGIPGSGKSEFTLFLMVSMAVNHGWKWGCFVPEAYPATDFYNECIVKLTGKNVEIGKSDRLSKEEYKVAMDFINEHFFFIYPQDDKDAKGNYVSNTFENVIAKIKELKLSKGIDGFFIDPLNQLTASSEFGGKEDKRLEALYGQIDQLCKLHNLSGNIVAHPRTQYREKGELDYPKPTPYQVAGGAMNYNKPYCIICVHRPFNQTDKGNTLVEIDIQKVKKHKIGGTPACISVNYNVWKGWYKAIDCPRNFGAIEGEFEKILNKKGVESKDPTAYTFTEKINIANGLDPFGDELPF